MIGGHDEHPNLPTTELILPISCGQLQLSSHGVTDALESLLSTLTHNLTGLAREERERRRRRDPA